MVKGSMGMERWVESKEYRRTVNELAEESCFMNFNRPYELRHWLKKAEQVKDDPNVAKVFPQVERILVEACLKMRQ